MPTVACDMSLELWQKMVDNSPHKRTTQPGEFSEGFRRKIFLVKNSFEEATANSPLPSCIVSQLLVGRYNRASTEYNDEKIHHNMVSVLKYWNLFRIAVFVFCHVLNFFSLLSSYFQKAAGPLINLPPIPIRQLTLLPEQFD